MSRLALLLHYVLVAQVLLHCEEIFAVGVFNFLNFFKIFVETCSSRQ